VAKKNKKRNYAIYKEQQEDEEIKKDFVEVAVKSKLFKPKMLHAEQIPPSFKADS
jgi:hypothetical protein